MSARPEVRRAALVAASLLALAAVSFLAFRGYLTTDMMVYFLTFQWCF
jgi:hypothetical protein